MPSTSGAIVVADAGTVTQYVKTTQLATIHVPHHNVDLISGTVGVVFSGAQPVNVSGTLPVQVSGTVPVVVSGTPIVSVTGTHPVTLASTAVAGVVSAGTLFSLMDFPVVAGGNDGTNIRTMYVSSTGAISALATGVRLVSGDLTARISGNVVANVSGSVAVSTVSGPVTVTGFLPVAVSGPVTISGGGGFITVSGTLPVQVSGTVPVVVSGTPVVSGDIFVHGLFSEGATLSGRGLFPAIVGGNDGTAARTIYVSSAGAQSTLITGNVVANISGNVVANVSGAVAISTVSGSVAISTVSGSVAISTVSGVVTVSGGNVNVVVSGAVVVSGGGGFILISGSGGFITVTGNVTASGTMGVCGLFSVGAVPSNFPIGIGGVALVTHSVTGAVSGGRTANLTDKYGAGIFIGWPVDLTQTTGRLISVTGETVIVAATASEFHDIIWMDVTHNAASGVLIQFRDVTASGTLHQRYLAAFGGMILPFGSTPLVQGTATAWTAAITTSDVTYSVNIMYKRRI